jgi:uncharacterized protein YndB with AHSA1/START domain
MTNLTLVRAQMDARVGGAYFRTLDGRDGHDHEACGEFLELVATRRIVMSWNWTVGGMPDERGRTSRIETELTPIGDETELTFTHTFLWNEASEKSHKWGWTGALDKLVRHLETPEIRHASSSTKENGT